MLRFIKHNLCSMDGVSIYPMISLFIFVIFFLGVLWYVARMKKSEINELSDMPLEKDDTNTDCILKSSQ